MCEIIQFPSNKLNDLAIMSSRDLWMEYLLEELREKAHYLREYPDNRYYADEVGRTLKNYMGWFVRSPQWEPPK